MCRNPYVTSDGKAYGCGQCMPCRVNRRRQWQHRIMLEAGEHKDNAFVTLTYNDDALTFTEKGHATLVPDDLRLWLMRLRTRLQRLAGPFPKSFRYYAVGEYGDESLRPHFHAMLFGFPSCAYGRSSFSRYTGRCCVACDLVSETWGKGIVQLGSVERESAGYISGYVTKKMTKDDGRLDGRYPEFARQSLKPGIGYPALWNVADAFLRYFADHPDVPRELRHGTRKMPLDRYMKAKLREMVGREKDAPKEVLEALVIELSELYEVAQKATEHRTMAPMRRFYFKNLLVDAGEHKAAAQASRLKLRRKRRVI